MAKDSLVLFNTGFGGALFLQVYQHHPGAGMCNLTQFGGAGWRLALILKLSGSESKVHIFQAILHARVTSHLARFQKDLLLVPGLPWYFREAVLATEEKAKFHQFHSKMYNMRH